MPSATMGENHGRPLRAVARARTDQKKERDGGKLKITPNFSFAKWGTEREGSSVCEQRNAALVRATLGEKEK